MCLNLMYACPFLWYIFNLLIHFTRLYFSMFNPLIFSDIIWESLEGAGLVKLMAFHFVSFSERLRPSSPAKDDDDDSDNGR